MILDLRIETLTLGGRGLGHHAGKAVFVPGTAPGDQVRCRVIRDHARYVEAQLVELHEAAAERRLPPCPVFGECGGCQWQHLPYAVQADWKERLFGEQLLRAGIADPSVIRPIVTAPEEFGYRNRIQLKCRQTAQGFVAGFYRHASHFVVDAPCCLLPRVPIRECSALLRRLLPSAPHPQAVPQVDIGCSDDDTVTVLLHTLPEAAASLGRWLRDTARRAGFAAALQSGRKETIEVLYGKPGLITQVDDPPFLLQTGVGGFTQINPLQNRRLIAAVVAAAALTGHERVLDLFCGVGNFTLPLARRAGAVVGVEGYPPAIGDATANAARHAVGNTSFFAEPAEGAALRHGPCDVVVLDPPRNGAYQVMRDLLMLRPQRIVYVSCDPATLVRDLKPLVHNGYTVNSSQPFDLFPQTWHIESLTVLERNG